MEPIQTHAEPQPQGDYFVPFARIRFFQWLGLPLARTLSRWVVSRPTILLERGDLSRDNDYLIVSNHESQADPFVIIGALPHWAYRTLAPTRFLAHTGLFRSRLTRYTIAGLGAIPTHAYLRYAYGLSGSRSLLARHQTVVIFPQGRRTHRFDELKPGVSQLAQGDNVMVLPVHITWSRHGWSGRAELIIGRPFDGHGQSQYQIMNSVQNLPSIVSKAQE